MNLTNTKRWIKASIFRELKNNTGGIPLIVEGENLTPKVKEHFELRIDGPYTKPLNGSMRLKIEVNILFSTTRDEANFYNREDIQGIAAQLLNRDFCIYKIGNTQTNSEDDSTLLGVMQLCTKDEIKLSDFGQIDPNVEIYQGVSEAHYEMYL